MSGSSGIVLKKGCSLKGADLKSVYEITCRNNAGFPSEDFPQYNTFKKSESLENLGKSLLKHRINELTGLTLNQIEEEMGFNSLKGKPLPTIALRKFAHYLISAANGNPLIDQQPQSSSKSQPRVLYIVRINIDLFF